MLHVRDRCFNVKSSKKKILIIINSVSEIEGDKVCFAMEAGNNEKIPCVFPFIYKGKKFDGCTNFYDPDSLPRCPTQVDGNGFFTDVENWGECSAKCKHEGV